MPESEAEAQAREWLQFAESDAALARGGLTRRKIFEPRQVCFHAQQAAEKAIKALLIVDQINFQFTHDLERLVQLLPPSQAMTVAQPDLAWLGQWATATRYPGTAEPSWADATRAVSIAETLVGDACGGLDTK
jgi:HEPN domain-containing protein